MTSVDRLRGPPRPIHVAAGRHACSALPLSLFLSLPVLPRRPQLLHVAPAPLACPGRSPHPGREPAICTLSVDVAPRAGLRAPRPCSAHSPRSAAAPPRSAATGEEKQGREARPPRPLCLASPRPPSLASGGCRGQGDAARRWREQGKPAVRRQRAAATSRGAREEEEGRAAARRQAAPHAGEGGGAATAADPRGPVAAARTLRAGEGKVAGAAPPPGGRGRVQRRPARGATAAVDERSRGRTRGGPPPARTRMSELPAAACDVASPRPTERRPGPLRRSELPRVGPPPPKHAGQRGGAGSDSALIRHGRPSSAARRSAMALLARRSSAPAR